MVYRKRDIALIPAVCGGEVYCTIYSRRGSIMKMLKRLGKRILVSLLIVSWIFPQVRVDASTTEIDDSDVFTETEAISVFSDDSESVEAEEKTQDVEEVDTVETVQTETVEDEILAEEEAVEDVFEEVDAVLEDTFIEDQKSVGVETVEKSGNAKKSAEMEDVSDMSDDVSKGILLEEQSEPAAVSESGLEAGERFNDDLFTYEVLAEGKVAIYPNFSNEVINIEIPKTVAYEGVNYLVTEIASAAFRGYDNLKNVVIPNSVVFIMFDAFKGCSGLTTVTIPNSVTDIGSSAFEGCSGLTTVNISNSVASIDVWTFKDCSSLTSIEIPDSVVRIYDGAFQGCSSLTSIGILDSVKYIDQSAFEGCASLTSIEIPDSVVTIGRRAFYDCNNLVSIGLPDWSDMNYSCHIEDYTFYNCSSLVSIDIPKNVVSIGKSAFEGCTSLVSVNHTLDWMKNIEQRAFYNCSSLTSIDIPDGVTDIEQDTFYGCSSLKSVRIPDGIKNIKYRAFQGCSSLTEVIIPDSVIDIYSSAFRNCSSLTNVVIPDSVSEIMPSAFQGCNNLISIDIPKGIIGLYSSTFDCDLEFIRFTGDVPSYWCAVDMFGSVGREIKVYYPINNITWTKELKKEFLEYADITWIPWDPETGEVFEPDDFNSGEDEKPGENVPSDATFYLGNGHNYYVYEEDKTILLWGGFRAIQEGNVIEEADAIVWESSDPLIAKINHVQYNPNTGSIYGNDNAYNFTYIGLYLDCFKPGVVTITGTSADGRTISTTMLIEPELVVKEEINISDETEIAICSFSVEEPNVEFLKEIISGITIKCKYSESPSVDERLEVTEDGLKASIVWEIVPEFDGNFIYEVKSLAGQKKEIRVNVDINEFNRGDTWHFKNYKVKGIPLTESDYARLVEGMSMTQKTFMDSLLSDSYNGQCYGMVTISLLAYKNVLSLNEIDGNISRLYDAINTTQVRSLIGYYHLSQLTDAVQQNMKYFKKLSTKEQLQAINNSKLPAILEFGHDGWGDHGVLIYKIEHGGPFMADGGFYDTMVSFYDPNDVWVSGSGLALYFNEGTDQWTIPRYAEKGISSSKGGYLRGLCADTNVWNNWSWSTSVLLPQWMRGWIATSDITLYTEDQTYVISGGSFSGDGEITVFYDDVAPLDDQELPVLNIRLEKETNCTIVPNAKTSLDWEILYEDYFLNASADSYDSISFDKEGAITATSLGGAYKLSFTTDESPLPWYTLEFIGFDAEQISIEFVEDGIQVSGDNLNNITVYGTNDVETKELTFSTDEDKVLLTEKNGELIIAQASDGDKTGNSSEIGGSTGSEGNAGNRNNTSSNNTTNNNTTVNVNANTNVNTNADTSNTANTAGTSILARDSVPDTGDSLNTKILLSIISMLMLGMVIVRINFNNKFQQ